MRGKAGLRLGNHCDQGITPAYAGKRYEKLVAEKYPEDHPRLCGEKASSAMVSFFRTGSPPPMRGKADLGCNVLHGDGITPAYAGKRLHDAVNGTL